MKTNARTLYSTFLIAVLMLLAHSAEASVNIIQCEGWFESGYVTWSPVDGATNYDVYVKASSANTWTKLDKELVRKYPTYYRADAVGLKAGSYQFKVEANNGESATSSTFTAVAHDRSGFAHVGMTGGIGAYKNDGTLKDGAKVIYVWADNAKTVTTSVVNSSKGGTATATGLQDIIYYYQKGYDKTPLAIRIIGTIKAADMDRFDSSAEGLQVKGNSNYSEMPITIEGIGNDAAIHGFGILVRNCKSTEFRNFAIMLCMDDCLSLDSYNSNVWVHNMDFFYGSTGGDADQAKGDGTVDIKGLSKNCTVSYNHFFDSGKCSLGGMKSETTDAWHTYHHNWFDHSDSRHPRIRVQFFHIYNNYYDGNSKYGVGVTNGGSAFVENNYFRNCKYPMLTSMQGSDIASNAKGTFSGEDGGIIKAYNNTITGGNGTIYYNGSQTDYNWDAVLVTSRDAAVTATCKQGGTGYNSEADLAARTSYIENKMEEPSTVVATVTGKLGAGRMNGGDFKWEFDNSTEDKNDEVIAGLKSALEQYESTLEGFADSSIGDDIDEPTGGEEPDEPTGGEEPDEPTGGNEGNEPTNDVVICHFTDNVPSSGMVTVLGNYSNSKGTVTYDEVDYNYCVKMESSTNITIKPTFDCDVTLVFDLASKRFKLDGTTYTTDADKKYTFAATKRTTYTLTKGDAMNLFLIIFTPKPTVKTLVDAIETLDENSSLDNVNNIVNKILEKAK